MCDSNTGRHPRMLYIAVGMCLQPPCSLCRPDVLSVHWRQPGLLRWCCISLLGLVSVFLCFAPSTFDMSLWWQALRRHGGLCCCVVEACVVLLAGPFTRESPFTRAAKLKAQVDTGTRSLTARRAGYIRCQIFRDTRWVLPSTVGDAQRLCAAGLSRALLGCLTALCYYITVQTRQAGADSRAPGCEVCGVAWSGVLTQTLERAVGALTAEFPSQCSIQFREHSICV